jgi:FkbM family methyltransferase
MRNSRTLELLDSEQSRSIIVVDAGAKGGAHKRWRDCSFPIKFIGFEPDDEECKKLTNDRETYLPYALWSSAGERTLYRVRSPFGSSFFEPNYPFVKRFVQAVHYEPRPSIEIPSHRLDDVLAEIGVFDIDMLKIDTEGAELEILNGAGALLFKAVAVEVEVWFDQVSSGAPLFADVDIYLRKNGFHLFDIARANYFRRGQIGGPKGQLVAGNALYFRWADGLSAEKAAKLAVLAAIYGHCDLAAEVSSSLGDQTVSDFVARRSRRFPRFRGKQRLAMFLRRMADSLSETISEEL